MLLGRSWFKFVFSGVSAISALMGVGAAAFLTVYPDVPPAEDLVVERSLATYARGEYLFNNVAACVDCHSTRDWSRFGGPVMPGTEGRGGDRFGHELGLPGEFYARNITPAGIGDWTDGEIKRALTAGVSRDGSPLFPIMPYLAFRNACDRDLDAIISYVRTLRPIENDVPPPTVDFPMSFLARMIPGQADPPETCPDPADTVSYGKYLVTMASCADCHTPKAEGQPIAGRHLAGGVKLPLPDGNHVYSRNLTPDPETGLGEWTRERFIARFKSMDHEDAYPEIEPGEPNTIMPWEVFSGMTEDDLGAIYDYLRTIPAVKTQVPPPQMASR
jgi:mono/diheme cytochrome c family protein